MEAGTEDKQWTIPTGLLARLNKAIAEDLANEAHTAPETLLSPDDVDSPATSQDSSFYDKIGSANSLHTDDSDKSVDSGIEMSARALRRKSRVKKRKNWGAESRVHDRSSDVSWEKQTFVTDSPKHVPSTVTASTADAVCKVGDRAAGSWTRYPPMAKLHKVYGSGGGNGAKK